MTKKKTTSASLINVSDKIAVPQIIEKLNDEIGKLKAVTDCAYKTSGQLDGFNSIETETKVENLIRMYSSVKAREEAYNDAAKDLGLNIYPQFKVGGGTSEDWKKDVQLRINVITHQEKLNKLNEYKEKMSKFLSEEDQKQMVLVEMAQFLKEMK